MTKRTNKDKVNNHNTKKVIKEQRKQIKQYICGIVLPLFFSADISTSV